MVENIESCMVAFESQELDRIRKALPKATVGNRYYLDLAMEWHIKYRKILPMKKRYHLSYLIFAVWAIFIINNLYRQQTQIDKIPYSEFYSLLKKERVIKVVVEPNYLTGEYRDPKTEETRKFVTVRIDPQIEEILADHNIEVSGVAQGGILASLLSWVLPAFVFIGLWLLVGKFLGSKGGMGGSLMSIGKSKAKVYVETDIKITLKDVAGVDEAKEELNEIINFLKNSEEYGRLGAQLPKGILLVGPPGTGKTLLARAIAGEAKVPFFSISGSEFVEMFVGVGAARVRDLFEQARRKSPCIIFIDELDALGRSRSGKTPGGGGNDEKEQTLNQLLVELDGFDGGSGIVLLAATNRPEILDPALLRSGRFDRQILVDRPDKAGRLAILKVHIKKIKKLDENVDLETIAQLTVGFSGADLANLVNEAALVATRNQAPSVNQTHFSQAIERLVAGLEKKSRILDPKEKERVAWHEMGHAIVAASLTGVDKVHKISIIPRGMGALGYTMQRPSDDRFIMTQKDLESRITVLLGGRAAELIHFNDLSSGASDDLAKASNIARDMVMRYGMDHELGSVVWQEPQSQFPNWQSPNREFSETTSLKIDTAIKSIIDKGLENATKILNNRKELHSYSVELLLKQETITAEEFADLLNQFPRA